MIIGALLTLIAFGLFAAGVRSLVLLCRSHSKSDSEQADPFFSSINLLFSTGERTEEFRRRQRRTIWLFCGAMLLLYVARVVFVQSVQG